MRVRAGIGLACTGMLLVSAVLAADLKSGLQPGDKVSPFHPLNVTGSAAGKKNCLV